MPETIGQRIQTAREARGMTQEQLAEAIGISKGLLASWETSFARTIKPRLLLRLSETLGVKPEKIVFGDKPPDVDREADEAITLAQSIYPMLAGKPPEVQGAALADLLAMWLAGHYLIGKSGTDQILDLHIATVRRLVPVNIARLRDR